MVPPEGLGPLPTLHAESGPAQRMDMGRRKQITTDKYDGTSSELRKYLNHFLIVTEVNMWNEEEQWLYLAGILTGVAQYKGF